MQEIFTRRSIRKFTNQAVEPEKIDKLLRAAMQAPSAANQQAWEFIVVQDKQKLAQVAETSPYAKPAAGSAVTFILLADEKKMKIPTGWEEDMGAAAENMLLEAVHLGLGGVWFGVATAAPVAENVSKLFGLPANIRPFALISVGYPDGQKNQFVDRYQPERVHYEHW
ncbi:nitroreductase family protein [Caproicibacterium argilliputei]|uniref:Nitroreductase family protein n=2 Tax=Oscillospiraceae TaxID=216572 RepID=A0AA97DDS3_9FIRM|nr:nitroreductase family protein [Caproicibacterium argilliputei]WOC33638.1 nitroreductase family protein [Caproicibacterium argilliputei]